MCYFLKWYLGDWGRAKRDLLVCFALVSCSDMADKQFCLLWLMLPFHGLSVTFVHCVQTAADIDFAYDSPMSLPNYIKI